MKHLALATLFAFSSVSNGNENNISDSDLRPAEVIDQELAEQLGLENIEQEEATEENSVEMDFNFNRGGRGGVIIRPGPRPMPRPMPRPIPRGPVWPRTYPRPIPIPIPIPTPYPRAIVTCYADNEYGQRFSGWAYFASDAQQNALNECYRYSSICYSRGCY